jgi:hypothetical protein
LLVPLAMSHRSNSCAFGAVVALLSVQVACSAALPASASRPHRQETAPLPPICRVTGLPIALARHVFVPAGVESRANHHGFEVRFAAARSRCVAIDWPSRSENLDAAYCPTAPGSVEASAVSGAETMRALQSISSGDSRLVLRIVTHDEPHTLMGFAHESGESVFERPFPAPSGQVGGGQSPAGLVPFGDERFLLLWAEGDLEGRRLRAQPVTGWGDPVGAALELSTADMSVIGRASAAIASNGEGLVAYLASRGDEFDMFVAPVACDNR